MKRGKLKKSFNQKDGWLAVSFSPIKYKINRQNWHFNLTDIECNVYRWSEVIEDNCLVQASVEKDSLKYTSKVPAELKGIHLPTYMFSNTSEQTSDGLLKTKAQDWVNSLERELVTRYV